MKIYLTVNVWNANIVDIYIIIMNVIGKQITYKQWSTSWYHNFCDVDAVISNKSISVNIVHASEINYFVGGEINSEKTRNF